MNDFVLILVAIDMIKAYLFNVTSLEDLKRGEYKRIINILLMRIKYEILYWIEKLKP